MFNKMQIKLTLLFTFILIMVLLATNLAIYFVLSSYNESQIVSETNRMLNSISSSQWLIKDENQGEEHMIEGVPEDNYNKYTPQDELINQKDLNKINTTEDSKDEIDKVDEIEDSKDEIDKVDETEDSKNETDKVDEIEDSKNETDKVDETEDSKNETDKVDEIKDSKDETDDENESEDDEAKSTGALSFSRVRSSLDYNYLSLINVFRKTGNNDSNEIQYGESNELIVPSTLDAFSFYFIYDNEGNLLKWKNDFNSLNDLLFTKSEDLIMNDNPVVYKLNGEHGQSFLMQKLPIIIDNKQVGYYTVGRDISIANQTMENLLDILLISLVLGVLISIVIGYLIAGRMMKPIKESFISKQRFLADASHELRTPISVVLLSCDTLHEELDQNEYSKKVVDGIHDEAIVMRDLVERLLQLARYDTGNIKYNKEKVQLSEIITSNIHGYQYIASQNNIEIEADIEEGLMTSGDKQLLNSAISILIDNAIKYNKSNGKVMVTGKTIYGKRKNAIQIQVTDTGKGIKKEDIDRIFTRFYRVDKSRGKTINGHGLGLSIAKEVVELHKGHMHVDSQLNHGSSFTISLPAL